MSCDFDVAVVGLGPVGLAAANLLASQGLTVMAFDMALQAFDKPRALGLDHEGLRLLQACGVADEIAPQLGEYCASEYRSASGAVLRRIVPHPEPYPLSWPPYVTFLQPELERLLHASWPSGQVQRSKPASSLSASASSQTMSPWTWRK